jgi:uncharacterized protein YgiM (DUF1202 family)
MDFSKTLLITLIISLLSPVFAADVNIPVEPNQSASANIEPTSFPYMAEITGTDVYIRSGPGTNYYRCGKVNQPDKVEVVGTENSWSKIVPPSGSFSWISKQYVALDANNPGLGTVTGDNVNVRAGSEFVEPIHSTSLQVQLNKGAKVKLLGEEKDDYYKITPPEGAYLWVSSEYLKNVGAAEKINTGIEPNAMPRKMSVETEKLLEYRRLARQIDTEHKKPAADQNWTEIKAKLTEIADDNQAGRAARYAKIQLENVKGFELARESGHEVQQQQSQLAQKQGEIEKARQQQLAQISNTGKFAVVGILRPSFLYARSSKDFRFLILGNNGKIIAYALPAESAENIDVSQYYGKKVGLVGSIERDPQTGSSLIRFTEVVEMK